MIGQPIKLLLDSIIISMAQNPEAAYGFLSFTIMCLLAATAMIVSDKKLRVVGGLSLPVIFLISKLIVESIS